MSTAQLTESAGDGYNQVMDTNMLYSPEDISRLEKKKRIRIAVVWLIAGGSLLACVGMCLAANTANAPQMERAVIVLSGAAGCVCLYLRRFAVGDALLELTQIGKECHSHCRIFHTMGECIMPTQGVFTRVLRGGRVKTGDIMLALPPEASPAP